MHFKKVPVVGADGRAVVIVSRSAISRVAIAGYLREAVRVQGRQSVDVWGEPHRLLTMETLES